VTEDPGTAALAQLEAELAHFDVADMLVHAASTTATLAYRYLERDECDLEQVRLALDALTALLPLLAGRIDMSVEADFRSAVAALRTGYERAGGRNDPGAVRRTI